MAIRRWLETPRPATWFQGFKKCVVAVDPDRGELSIEATG
jgi:hypothetical protein